MIVAVALFIASAALSTVATWRWLSLAERLLLIDPPNPLVAQHHRHVVTAGGLPAAMAASVILGLVWTVPALGVSADPDWAVLFSGTGFLLLGLADDVLRMSARSKFLAQVALAI